MSTSSDITDRLAAQGYTARRAEILALTALEQQPDGTRILLLEGPPGAKTTTAENITEAQIRRLRQDAMAAGDYPQVAWCDLALAAHETSDSHGNLLVTPDNGSCGRGGEQTTRTEARKICADAIADGAYDLVSVL
jgi:hypothetical protein